MRWSLLVLSALFSGLGLLTMVRSPDWLDWRINVLTCSFGYWLSLVPLALALVAPALGRDPLVPCIAALGLVGFALLAHPCLQARLIGRSLPASLGRAFGPASPGGAPFSLKGLVRRWPRPVSKRTLAYAGDLKLDLYPAGGRSPAPCVIVIHGGGWDSGDRGQISHFNDWLSAQGYAVADLSYRLAPQFRWPAQREDVEAAFAFLKANAPELGIDASRLFLLGRSAGGQIAEAVGYGLRDPALRGVIALYAPADMHFAYAWAREDDVLRSPQLLRKFLGGTPDQAKELYDSASGILLVNPACPPTLLVHGSIDTLVWNRQSRRLAARLTEAGVPNLLLEMPWATHALEYNPDSPSGQLTAYAVAWFLAARSL